MPFRPMLDVIKRPIDTKSHIVENSNVVLRYVNDLQSVAPSSASLGGPAAAMIPFEFGCLDIQLISISRQVLALPILIPLWRRLCV